jgi:hypothetical protein
MEAVSGPDQPFQAPVADAMDNSAAAPEGISAGTIISPLPVINN